MDLERAAMTLPVPFHTARESVALARRAEEEWGYDALWLAETSGPDSFSLAGALAEATSRVTIGTAIVPVYNRTPAVLAMSAGTLAQLSDDRFVLGLGRRLERDPLRSTPHPRARVGGCGPPGARGSEDRLRG
jgi:alkanesulfonate monooxygenase SsuD/methylene tetrahydromethanopterin reductase-like flavin-dependent oxidoreductase (luciferase family)